MEIKDVAMPPYRKRLKAFARELRKNPTDAERLLWSRLRKKQLLGLQVYRQRPIGEYIVDFYVPGARMVIEIDGSQHFVGEQSRKDEIRDSYMKRIGLRVLRFNSREVLKNTNEVVEVIFKEVEKVLRRNKGD